MKHATKLKPTPAQITNAAPKLKTKQKPDTRSLAERVQDQRELKKSIRFIEGKYEQQQRPLLAAIAENHTPSPAPHRELTAIQAEIAAEMAGMVLHGGHRDDVELVLRGLMQHQYRRKFFNDSCDLEEQNNKSEQFAENFWTNWFTELAKHWPPPKNRDQHESVSESAPMRMFRSNMRGELVRLFDEFISDAENPEEVWLLKEVLQFVDGGYPLADSFACVIAGDETYISVPAQHVKLVKEYIQLLNRKS